MTVLIKRTTVLLTLQSSETINLDSWLSEQNVPNRDIIITIPATNTIGSTIANTAAITSGDLSNYKSVSLVIDGDILGAGGARNSGYGGIAINITTPIKSLIINGAVKGGGGGGSRGGRGADGQWVEDWVIRHDSETFWSQSACQDDRAIRWDEEGDGGKLGYACNHSYIYNTRYGFSGVYANAGGTEAYAPIKRAPTVATTGGSGRYGGYGEGYTQSRTNGTTTGSNGGDYAGPGGNGGNGSTWGLSGGIGNIGSTGTKWKYLGQAVGTGDTDYDGKYYGRETSTLNRGTADVGGPGGLAINGFSHITEYINNGVVLGNVT